MKFTYEKDGVEYEAETYGAWAKYDYKKLLKAQEERAQLYEKGLTLWGAKSNLQPEMATSIRKMDPYDFWMWAGVRIMIRKRK